MIGSPVPSGALPTFLIPGAMKAGTTSLARMLRRHPDIGMASSKELHYFDGKRIHSPEAYAAKFAGVADRHARFEATPSYLYLPAAARRIASELPATVRFVIMLRDPVDRAYSQYWHGRRVGAIDASFEEALRREPAMLGRNTYGFWSLVDRGRYVGQLRRFEALFGRERLLVVLFEEFVREPARAADRVAAFVGVAPLGEQWGAVPHEHRARRSLVPPAIVRRLKKGALAARVIPGRLRYGIDQFLSVPFEPPPMDPATRATLAQRFRADNDELESWLGRDLSIWSR